MTRTRVALFALTLICGTSSGFAQNPAVTSAPGVVQPSVPVDEIVRRFAAKEKQFKIARESYTYQQEVKVQELDGNDRPTGEYNLVSDILFDSKGRRTEHVVYAPMETLKRISMSPQDMQDLKEIQPFVLTTDDIQKYNLKYMGKEKVDEIECYLFEVSPKKIEKDQRYFEGQIWVDDQDLQIVKTYGKAVPDIRHGKGDENLFPKFETYREQVDGKYWFPTYTRAVDTLRFSTGAVRMREIIKYDKYKKFEADVKLKFGDVVDENGKSTGAPVPTTKAPALDPSQVDPKKKP